MTDDPLRFAWTDFCRRLEAAGDLLSRPLGPAGEADRAAGLRLLSRNIALALSFELENADPLAPDLQHYFDPVRKQGGDNPDGLYLGAPIDGQGTYRITGQRGSARYLAITVVERGATPFGGAPAATLLGDDLQCEPDGRFTLTLSPEPPPGAGNWMRTTPDSFRVTIRQFFADWENEVPLTARIERMGASVPPPVAQAQVTAGLAAAADWHAQSLTYWTAMLEKWKAQPNRFLTYGQLDGNRIDATPGGAPVTAYWMLPRDEALVLRLTPPAARYWSLELGNHWWESLDYRHRLVSSNCHHAVAEADGSLVVVLAHDDPGLPNWLDPSGHLEGYLTFRWIGCTAPEVAVAQVRAVDLDRHLPAGARRVTAAWRAEQLASRRRGIARRFPI